MNGKRFGQLAALGILGIMALAGCPNERETQRPSSAHRAQQFQRLRIAGRMLESSMKGEAIGMAVLEDRSFRQAFREFETELGIAKAALDPKDDDARAVIAAYEDVQSKAKEALAPRTEAVNTIHKYMTTLRQMTPEKRQQLEDSLQGQLQPGYLAVRAALDHAESLLN